MYYYFSRRHRRVKAAPDFCGKTRALKATSSKEEEEEEEEEEGNNNNNNVLQ